jgi:hypothetical protein
MKNIIDRVFFIISIGTVFLLFLGGCAVGVRPVGPLVLEGGSPMAQLNSPSRNFRDTMRRPSYDWRYTTFCYRAIRGSIGGDSLAITYTNPNYVAVLNQGNIVLSDKETFIGDLSKIPSAFRGDNIIIVIDFYEKGTGNWVGDAHISVHINGADNFQRYNVHIQGPCDRTIYASY